MIKTMNIKTAHSAEVSVEIHADRTTLPATGIVTYHSVDLSIVCTTRSPCLPVSQEGSHSLKKRICVLHVDPNQQYMTMVTEETTLLRSKGSQQPAALTQRLA